MDLSDKKLNPVYDNLLSFLREQLGEAKVDYEAPPSKIQGGNETSIFKFKLKSVHPSLSGPLILRVFRKGHPPEHAIRESVVHHSMIDQGFPVPYVHYACKDPKYLGRQFLMMDFLPGSLLPSVFGRNTNIVLGKMHAALHKAKPGILNKNMITKGFGGRHDSIEERLDRLLKASERLPWLEEIILWLMEYSPAGCEHPSICHGDFHPYNLLAKDGEVTAILDWSVCRIGDPVMDVASTWVVYNAATKHLIPSFDACTETRKYLDAYQSEKDLNEQHLGYYKVLACVMALFAGTNGVNVWTRPPIQAELLDIIYNFSNIRVEVPG